MLNQYYGLPPVLFDQRKPPNRETEWETRSQPQLQVAHLPLVPHSARIPIPMCSRVRQPTMVYLRVRIRVMDNALLLMNPMAIRPLSRRVGGTMRDAGSILIVRLIPRVTLLLTGVSVTVLFGGTTIDRRLRHCGCGAGHGRIVRRAEIIAVGVVLLVVGLLFSNQGAAAAEGTKLFGIVIVFGITVALEVGFLAGAGSVVVRGRWAVRLLFLVVAIQ